MKVFYSPLNKSHHPKYELFEGVKTPHAEVPKRVDTILEALKDHELIPVTQLVQEAYLENVHNAEYLTFLFRTSAQLDSKYIYPSVFNTKKSISPKISIQLGAYSSDMYTPINKNTYTVAKNSAALATQAATTTKIHGETTYALCRPPGHHASLRTMGGYCYLNNAAIAADYLYEYGKVAILDVDFHHGNGTQDIFYKRNDVLTVSIHANPRDKFPYFSGFLDEVGSGKGRGYNKNILLELGATEKEYDMALFKALDYVEDFKPKYLIVAFGADTHKDDPIGGFKLTTEYYERMAQHIKELKIPTVIIQEGGYNTALLGKNVHSFLSGF